jgi:hypothetical protein
MDISIDADYAYKFVEKYELWRNLKPVAGIQISIKGA